MPKLSTAVAGGIADVSSDFPVAAAGVYQVKIEGAEMKKNSKGGDMIVVTTAILDETDVEGKQVKGIQMFENFTIADVNGKPQQVALRFFKKLVETTLGSDKADDPDFDTDWLIGWTGEAQVEISSYTDKNGKTVQKNDVKQYVA